jgi:nitrite reductase/ring-hydroxylating ferredoxin subunit
MEIMGTSDSSITGTNAGANALARNEFRVDDFAPGKIRVVQVEGEEVAVYNVAGTFYATQARCPHAGWPLDDGELDGQRVTCPMHYWAFDVAKGTVVRGSPYLALRTFRVTLNDGVGRVECAPEGGAQSPAA